MDRPRPTEAPEIDRALDPLGQFVAGFGAVEALDPLQTMRLDVLALDLPVELAISQRSDGSIVLGGAPPTQYLETSVMPVFHRLRIRIERDDDGRE